ncbi:hypothetical protein GCM10025883_39180 [Mobilicoccus caccae]|uniref:Uncharacterized protein n=1 Tax=Mobilicoccus caccae TaxID=1859295 RepID=A0ABQ6IV96_9MICO|nr:hypothetical protein GCM10025883_39180 [Mobilicoccus caccae]
MSAPSWRDEWAVDRRCRDSNVLARAQAFDTVAEEVNEPELQMVTGQDGALRGREIVARGLGP